MSALERPQSSEAYASLETRILQFIEGTSNESFESLLLEAHAFQVAYNPYMATFSTSTPTSWKSIPAIPQEAFKEFRISTFSENESIRVFHTSGTTKARPGKHWFRSLRLYERAAYEGWRRAGLARDYLIIALLPHPQTAPHSSLAQMAAWLTPQKNFVLTKMENLQEMASNSPTLLFGTALAFLDYFEKFPSFSLPTGSLAVETGGYKGTQREISKIELYKLFEQHFGLATPDIMNEYGMTELSSQFYARGISSPHHAPPWARALVIDPETDQECPIGGTGILRLFDLANLGSTCVLETRDLAIRRENGFELLGRDPSALPRGCSLISL